MQDCINHHPLSDEGFENWAGLDIILLHGITQDEVRDMNTIKEGLRAVYAKSYAMVFWHRDTSGNEIIPKWIYEPTLKSEDGRFKFDAVLRRIIKQDEEHELPAVLRQYAQIWSWQQS